MLLLKGSYSGFNQGVLSGVLRLVVVAVVTVATINFAGVASDWLEPWVRFSPVVRTCATFWLLFFILLFLGRLLLGIAGRFLAWERLNGITRTIGLLFGAARGLWWAGVVLLAFSASGFEYLQDSTEHRAMFAPQVLNAARGVVERASDVFPGSRNRDPGLIPPARSAH